MHTNTSTGPRNSRTGLNHPTLLEDEIHRAVASITDPEEVDAQEYTCLPSLDDEDGAIDMELIRPSKDYVLDWVLED